MVGLTKFIQTRSALAAATTARAISQPIRNRRLSTMSANAPAGNAKMNMGRLLATWTRETINGSGLRLVMSQPDAALYIQVPMFAFIDETATTVKVVWRKAIQGE